MSIAVGAMMSPGTGVHAQETRAPTAEAPATADVGEPANVNSYQGDFFKSFQPTSALDMVQRVPGFTYNKGSTEIRGFNGSSGNVLIDGERPASKSIPLDDILKRIAVKDVIRIDIIRGGAAGIDMQGQAVVVNVVRGVATSRSLAAELWTKLYSDHDPARIFRAEASRRAGPVSIEGAVHLRQEKEQNNSGKGRIVRRDGAGALIASGPFESIWDRTLVQGNGGGEYRFGRGKLRINLGGLIEWQDRADVSDFSSVTGTRFGERLTNDYRIYQLEGGVDLERSLGGGLDGRVLALRTRKGERQSVVSQNQGPLQVSDEDNVQDETIGRVTLAWQPAASLSLEIGGEGALNRLDAATALRRAGVPVVLPSANIQVRERRAEGFVTARWKVSTNLAFDGGLRVETSTIEQSGDANQKRILNYKKPRATLSWDVAASTQIRLRGERTVGQLNFKDFAATAALDTGSANAGNPNLLPERAWVVEAAVERRFWNKGVLVLSVSRAQVDDVADFVPVNGFDAPGNIGDGTRDEYKASLSVPGERFGLGRTLLRFNGTWRRSEVKDPVTGAMRRISRQRPFEGDVLLTRDIPALKSTASLEASFGYRETAYRIRELRTESDSTALKFYWDWTPVPSINVRLQAENMLSKNRRRERILFSSTRAGGATPNLIERRNAQLPAFAMIRVRKTF